jgi:hypothetical protein
MGSHAVIVPFTPLCLFITYKWRDYKDEYNFVQTLSLLLYFLKMPLRPQKDKNTTRSPRSHVNSHRIRPESASKEPERVQNYEI